MSRCRCRCCGLYPQAMIIFGMAAARRRLRQHQDIPQRVPHKPLWRLLLGEATWAFDQLVRAPRVLVALLIGAVVTPVLLGAMAPGPVLPWPGRVLVGLLVGLALARGTWAWIRRRARAAHDVRRNIAPGVAAAEIVAALAGLVLLGWLVVWVVTLLA